MAPLPARAAANRCPVRPPIGIPLAASARRPDPPRRHAMKVPCTRVPPRPAGTPLAPPEDLRAWLAGADGSSLAEVVDMLQADQLRRWRRGERVPAEAYLALYPPLSDNPEH